MKHQPQTFTDLNILVTGATGFVGARLVARLLELGANVTCFIRDDEPASVLHRSGDLDRISVVTGRLEEFAHVRTAIVEREPDIVFHLGAQAIVRAGRVDPLGTFESNIRGTYHLLEACRLYRPQIRSIVIASSDKAYGECEALPYTETTPLAAQNPYDVSKSCADLIAQCYAASYGLPIAIARCGNIFGPGDLHWSRLVPGTIRSLLRGENPIIRSDGTPVRDYLFIDDAVEAYVCLAKWAATTSPKQDAQRAFNFSGGCALSVLEMTRLLQRACDRQDLEPVIQRNATGEIAEQELDCTRARQVLGWRAQAEIVSALHETVQWYRRYFDRAATPHPTARLHHPQHSPRTRASA
jgi:CDP-glucose 4,6-dehydratase